MVAEVRAEIINKIAIAEEEGILFGKGTNGEIKGVFTDIPEFSLTSLKVKNPNNFDALVAGYTQIVSVSNQNYAAKFGESKSCRLGKHEVDPKTLTGNIYSLRSLCRMVL